MRVDQGLFSRLAMNISSNLAKVLVFSLEKHYNRPKNQKKNQLPQTCRKGVGISSVVE